MSEMAAVEYTNLTNWRRDQARFFCITLGDRRDAALMRLQLHRRRHTAVSIVQQVTDIINVSLSDKVGKREIY